MAALILNYLNGYVMAAIMTLVSIALFSHHPHGKRWQAKLSAVAWLGIAIAYAAVEAGAFGSVAAERAALRMGVLLIALATLSYYQNEMADLFLALLFRVRVRVGAAWRRHEY